MIAYPCTIYQVNNMGFRGKRTTSLALIDFVKEISKATEKKEYTAGIILDLQKAFDTIINK